MATAKIVLDTRHKKPDNRYYVAIRITDDRRSKYYPCTHKKYAMTDSGIKDTLDLSRTFTKTEFDRIVNAKRRSDIETDYEIAFTSFRHRANEIINSLNTFHFETFAKLWGKKRSMKGTLKSEYENKIAALAWQKNLNVW